MQRLQPTRTAPGLPAAPSVALFQSPEPSTGSRPISPICAPATMRLSTQDSAPPRPQMFRGADARGPAGHPLSGPDADHARGY